MAGTALPALTEGGITSCSPQDLSPVRYRQQAFPCNTPAGLEETKPCIPAGSRIMISYNNKVSQGERRIEVAADRLIFPDSTSMNLGHQVIADASGYSGPADERETHLGERLLNATLFAAVQGVFTLGSAALGADQVNGRPVESVAQDEAQSGMRIPPTLRIRPGFPFVVMLKQDEPFAGPDERQEFAASEGSE